MTETPSPERDVDQPGVEHPEVDRAYDWERGGQVLEEQDEADTYHGPDPEDDDRGDGAEEDQGV